MLGKPSKCAKMPFCLAVIAHRTPDTMPDHLKLMKVRKWMDTNIYLSFDDAVQPDTSYKFARQAVIDHRSGRNQDILVNVRMMVPTADVHVAVDNDADIY